MRYLHLCCWISLLLLPTAPVSGQTLQLTLRGQQVEGKPLFWNEQLVTLLARDGYVWQFHPDEAREVKKHDQRFRAYTPGQLRVELIREFGSQFDVSSTGHYLVVHPAGQRDLWARRFDELYRAMVNYFSVRGFEVHPPKFPLVAVVFANQRDFFRYVRQRRIQGIHATTLGFYEEASNRIVMYDSSTGGREDANWFLNAETIIHEAAHQTAFNIGIHRRFNSSPSWVVEGIGTLFEARGVWDPRHNTSLASRINQTQLRAYRRLVDEQNSLNVLVQQLSSDRFFQQQTNLAYAHAWALTFYLSEREPTRYAEYLERVNAHPMFEAAPSAQTRLEDFTSVFGANLQLLDARLQRFIRTLPQL